MKKGRIQKIKITKQHSMFNICDELCFKAKNLYNYDLYIQRQRFIKGEKIYGHMELNKLVKHSEPFKDLGSNSGQCVGQMLDRAWKSFFVSIKDYSKNPSKYLGRPKLPKYKDKNGRYTCCLTNMQSQIQDGYLYFAFKPLKPFNNMFKIKFEGKHMQTRIVPKGTYYILEIVYQKEVKDTSEQQSKNIASIDLGLNNFVTMVNNINKESIVINGKGIKSYNKYWNKQIAKYRSVLKKNNDMHWSKRLSILTNKRNARMDYFMHCASKAVINYCLKYNIDTVVVGLNKKWKQESDMSKKVNQSFIQVPYESFINKLKYKCEDYGIKFITTEESYTSGTSFLDEELPVKANYNKSRRVHRGLFVSNTGKKINSDVNGAYQIMKKVFRNAYANGIEGANLHPVVVNII